MSTFDDVKHILKDVLQLGDKADTLGLDTVLLGGIPEFDSMAVVNVITAIEEQFDIVIEDDDIDAETFETLGSLVRFVEQKLAS